MSDPFKSGKAAKPQFFTPKSAPMKLAKYNYANPSSSDIINHVQAHSAMGAKPVSAPGSVKPVFAAKLPKK